ncbi:MAG: hypothetical protein ACF8R7_08920 [Phycisphaerales bacterium JB039]
MRPLPLFCCALAAAVLTGCQTAGIEGTYVLTSRDLPDGTTVYPPNVVGLLTFEDGQRNFNIYEGHVEGAPTSISVIAEYTLSKDEYRETNIYTLVAGPDGVQRDLAPAIGSSPITREDGAIKFLLPLRDEPAVEFTSRGLTATRPGEFVDHWKRID